MRELKRDGSKVGGGKSSTSESWRDPRLIPSMVLKVSVESWTRSCAEVRLTCVASEADRERVAERIACKGVF